MKKRISIDSLMNQTLGFNTKSFSESKTISVNKKFNYGELGNAMLTFKADKYAMIAEAATLKADLVTMKARGESKVIDKVKSAGKAIIDAVIKLFQAFRDMIKNFLARHNDTQKRMHIFAKQLLAMDDKHRKNELLSSDKCKAAEKKGVKITVIKDVGGIDLPDNFKLGIVADAMYSIKTDGMESFLDELIPNGSDESIGATEYEKKLKDYLEPEMKELRENIRKIKKDGFSLEKLPFREGLDSLIWLMRDLLNIAETRLKEDLGHKIRATDGHLREILKMLNSYRSTNNEDGSTTSVSDKNMAKTRLALHTISNYYTTYMDATNVTNTNITKCMLITIITIKPFCK